MTFEDYRRWRDNEEEPDEPSYLAGDRIFSKKGVFERDDEEYEEYWTPPERPNLASGGLFDFSTAPPTLVVSNPNESTNKTQSYSSFNHLDPTGGALNQPGLKLTEEERQILIDTLKYIWGTVIGDWNNESDPLQGMYNMGAGLIPVVDQVLDVRDLTAHLYYMVFEKDYTSLMRWVSLVLTAIGAIPTIGSVVKGIGKLTIFHGGAKAAAKYSEPFLDALKKINPEWADIGTLKAEINANWDDGVAEFKDLWFKTLTNVKGTVDSIPTPPGIKKFSEFKQQIQEIIGEIQGLSTSKLDESFNLIRRQIDEFLDTIILGQKRQLSADGVGNVSPSRIEPDGLGRNQPMVSQGNSNASGRVSANIRDNLSDSELTAAVQKGYANPTHMGELLARTDLAPELLQQARKELSTAITSGKYSSGNIQRVITQLRSAKNADEFAEALAELSRPNRLIRGGKVADDSPVILGAKEGTQYPLGTTTIDPAPVPDADVLYKGVDGKIYIEEVKNTATALRQKLNESPKQLERLGKWLKKDPDN